MTSPQRARPRAGRRVPGALSRYRRWIAFCAAVPLTGLAVAYLSGSGARPAAASAGAGRPATVIPAAAGRTVAPDESAVIAAEPPPPPRLRPGLARALARWNSGPGGTVMTAVSSAVSHATQASGLQFYSAMRDACVQVAARVSAAKGRPPIPSAASQGQYSRALDLFAKAAAGCESGISVRPDGDEDLQTHQNQRLLHRSGADFTSGSEDLYRATAALRELILSR